MVSHLFPVGIMTSFPKEWVGLIFDRSGMGVKGIMRQAGVIDSGYRGEWKVKLINLGTEVIHITKEKAIAQVVFVPCMKGIEFVDVLPDSIRGDKWNGSTDVISSK
jgi:dUTP pyrophosphatase